jgi:predicted RNA-binding protein YlqC (UPF0109 family)
LVHKAIKNFEFSNASMAIFFNSYNEESSSLVGNFLRVAKSDMGKVIGKKGRMAEAIRAILSAASGKVRKRYILEIME